MSGGSRALYVLALPFLARIHSQSNLIFTTIPRGQHDYPHFPNEQTELREDVRRANKWQGLVPPWPSVSNTFLLTQLSQQCSEKAAPSSPLQKLASYVVKPQFARRTPCGDQTVFMYPLTSLLWILRNYESDKLLSNTVTI